MSVVARAGSFLARMTGIRVRSLPRVKISKSVKDSAWYARGTIFINPGYNPERLTRKEMIAHEFFHHVQHELGIRLGENKLESSAMFFTGAFMNKGSKRRIAAYLLQKKHKPKGGNRYALSAFRSNKYSVANTLAFMLKK